MSKKLVFILFILLIFVLLFKFLLGEKFGDLLYHCGSIVEYFRDNSVRIAMFLRVFLLPFSLSLLFLYCFLKYRSQYWVIVQWIVGLLLSVAIWSSFNGIFWVLTDFRHFFENNFLLSFLTYVYPIEVYLSLSLVLLLICLFFFAFGKKNIPKEDKI